VLGGRAQQAVDVEAFRGVQRSERRRDSNGGGSQLGEAPRGRGADRAESLDRHAGACGDQADASRRRVRGLGDPKPVTPSSS